MSANVKRVGDTNPLPDPREAEGGLVEGPGRQCTIGDCGTNPFATKSAKEWLEHLRQNHKNTYEQGVAPCVICGGEVDLLEVRVRAGNKAIHPECVPEVVTSKR